MIYAGDQWIQYPVKDLYDKTIMQMSIAAARDMYEKGQKQIDDFNAKYGDFLSPFAKDMERYGQIVGGVRDIINNAYANGVDPLRSPEGRALVAQAIRSVNPAEINAMKANAKMGYAYQDAMQKLRSNGKFSQAQEDFDIAQNGGTAFQDFATANGQGGFNSWDRSSPIEATTLRDLTQDSYKGRTSRTLTKEDFLNDPRLAGKYAYDPRYEWTGYLYSDLLKNAPGASASLAADPRAAFFRDQARQMVIAQGKEPTAENVEAQFQRNIADANTWALVDPTRKADEYAKLDYENKLAISRENIRHRHAMDEAGAKNADNNSGGYLKALALNAQGIRTGFLSAVTDKNTLNTINSKIGELSKIKDPKELQKRMSEINKLSIKAQKEGMRKWLYDKSVVDGRSTVADIILNLKDGAPGVGKVNDILGNFATNSSSQLTGPAVLEQIGFYKDENGTYTIGDGEDIRVVTPHKILNNIIKYESSDFKGKQRLMQALSDNEDTRTDNTLWPDWALTAKTNRIANRTKTVRPTASNKGVIVAPDEMGVNRLYVKVQTVGTSFGDGDHNGYWVETPITYGQDLGITSQSTPIIQGSEEFEGKQFGNSQRKEAYINQN